MSEITIGQVIANRKKDGFPPIGDEETLAPLVQMALGAIPIDGRMLRYLHDASSLLPLLARKATGDA